MANSVDIVLTASDQSSAAFASLNANIAKATAQLAAMQSPMAQVTAMAEQAKTAFLALGGALVIDKLLELDANVMRTVGALKAQAESVGLTTDAFQAYLVAARESGVGTEQMQATLGKFNVSVGEAAAGNKTAADAFQNLGVKIFDAQGKVRPLSDLLTETSKALVDNQSSAQRAAAGHDIFGRSVTTIIPALTAFSEGLGKLSENASRSGQVFSKEVIDQIHELGVRAEESEAKISVLWAAFAAPIKTGAMSFVAQQMKEIADSIALADTHRDVLSAIAEILNVMSLGTGAKVGGLISGGDTSAQARALQSIADLEGKVVASRRELAQVEAMEGAQSTASGQAAVSAQKQRVGAAEQELDAAQKVYQAWQKAHMPTGQLPAITTTGSRFATATGGSDRVADQMAKLVELNKAAQTAYDQYSAAVANGPVSPELQRQIDLTKKIADDQAAVAKVAHDDPRLPQMLALVASTDTLNAKTELLKSAQKDADAIDRQYGDGQRGLIELQDKLNLAVQQGGLSTQTAALALVEYTKQAEDARLKNLGLQGGMVGLYAGFQNAANQYTRANTTFVEGGQLFQQTMSLMDQATQQFVQNGTIQFDKLLQSFLNMIIQMEMRAAASSLFNGGGGGGGGLFGGILGFLGLGGDANAGGFATVGSGAGVTNGVPNFTGMASGGDLSVGVPTWVGERGPELVMPKTGGTVIPNHELGGVGGVTVINQMSFGSDVDRNTLMRWGEQVKAQTLAAVIDARRRGGPMKTAFS